MFNLKILSSPFLSSGKLGDSLRKDEKTNVEELSLYFPFELDYRSFQGK